MPQATGTDVPNQSPDFSDIDLWSLDLPLQEAAARARLDPASLQRFGRERGSAELLDLGRLANRHGPVLHTFDAKERRLDRVEFHPAYHELMRRGAAVGLHNSTWTGGSHSERAVRFYLAAQSECGHLCPLTMTHAAPAALRASPTLFEEWLPRILTGEYDPSSRAPGEKAGVTLGMGMTEKQGGTDVRANTTRAEPIAEEGLYRITGHKWFMSAPMSDAFLVLAQAPGGLTAFLMPRILPDGTNNALRFQRLKDKLGNRSNASSEVEFEGALAHRVGEEGRGVATILEMVTLTRLDCALASAGLMRLGLSVAIHHARHRSVFGRPLVAQPLMRAVLADLALEVEAAVALVFRLAAAFDRAGSDRTEAAFARLMTPVVKYTVCKRAPAFLYEAMECLGGNGYVEDGLLARAYREAPVNAIWEGSGNVMALDLMRVLTRDKEAVEAVFSLLRSARGEPRLAAALEDLRALASRPEEAAARHLAEQLATTVAAALLQADAPGFVADAFIAFRLEGRPSATYRGITDPELAAPLVERAFPA